MVYDFVLIDKIFCECFIKWTYEENDETSGRKGLLDLHLKSAMKKSNEDNCILIITSITKEDLKKQYEGNERDLCHLSSITEASNEINIPINVEEVEAILKAASYLKWKKFSFCILTGNSLIYDLSKKEGFDVYSLNDADKVLRSIR